MLIKLLNTTFLCPLRGNPTRRFKLKRIFFLLSSIFRLFFQIPAVLALLLNSPRPPHLGAKAPSPHPLPTTCPTWRCPAQVRCPTPPAPPPTFCRPALSPTAISIATTSTYRRRLPTRERLRRRRIMITALPTFLSAATVKRIFVLRVIWILRMHNSFRPSIPPFF